MCARYVYRCYRFAGCEGAADKQDAVFKFVWNILACGFDEERPVLVRFDHACSQGVPLPGNWKIAMQCVGLPDKAKVAAKQVKEAMFLDTVECVYLGRPKCASLPRSEDECAPGVIVHLQHEGSASYFLLAAHVAQDQWLCHSGGPVDDPFNVAALHLKDIVREAAPIKKRRRSNKTNDLKTLVLSNTNAWAACVAEAIWKAEIARACAFDLDRAATGYESNPFRWNSESRLSHAEITFAWSWMCRGEWRRELSTARADDLIFNSREVPRPATLRCDDDSLLSGLQWITRDVALC